MKSCRATWMWTICLAAGLLTGRVAAAELKIATWNLEWLTARPEGDPALPADVHPKNAADIAALRQYAATLDADVVALQEVDGPEIAAALFPSDRYTLVFSNDHIVQRVGFAIRRGMAFHRNADLTALDLYPEAKFRLRSGVDVTLDVPGGGLRLLAVHLKTGCHFDHLAGSLRPQCATLRDQVAVLRGWAAQRRAEGAPFLMIGDFNRVMDAQDDVLASLQAAALLTSVTAGRDSPCWGGGHFIDHILAGGPARAWLDPASLRVLVYREPLGMREHLSDHCPVSARFHLPG